MSQSGGYGGGGGFGGGGSGSDLVQIKPQRVKMILRMGKFGLNIFTKVPTLNVMKNLK